MTHKLICEGKYYLGGPNLDTIALPVLLKHLPENITVEGRRLLLRSSFHCTLVAIGKIIGKHDVKIPDFVSGVIEDFCAFVKKNPIELVGFKKEFKSAVQGERASVVVMCGLTNLDAFFDLLNKKYGLALECPPTHVTLYTLQPDLGIFLVDNEDIKNLTKKIPAPVVLN